MNVCGGGGNWRQNRDNQNLGVNWRNNRNDRNFDQNQVNQREIGVNGCHMTGVGHSLGGLYFNASSCRENLRDRSPSREISGDNQDYQDFISWRSQHGNTSSRRARMDNGDSPDRERPTKRPTIFHRDGE